MVAVYLLDAVMGFLLLVYCGFLLYLIRGRRAERKHEQRAKSYSTCHFIPKPKQSSQKPFWERFDQYSKNPGSE